MKTRAAHSEKQNRKRFDRWCQLEKLYDACLENAESLHAEAKLLLENGHVARAFALAYTGWEEVGKAQLVADFANGMAAETEFEDAFRKHNLKLAYNHRRFVVNMSNVPLATIEYESSKAQSLFDERNASLYVAKGTNDSALIPRDAISREAARESVAALRRELDHIFLFDTVNERIGSASFLK
jgi:AbiV family abortive infection protein